VGLTLETLAFYGYRQALKEIPLSLSLPFLAFTPAFIVLNGWMLLGETVSLTGLLGIFLIMAGLYCLNIFSILHRDISLLSRPYSKHEAHEPCC
jgi:drug/metabolite transporter (DMT)-like permease